MAKKRKRKYSRAAGTEVKRETYRYKRGKAKSVRAAKARKVKIRKQAIATAERHYHGKIAICAWRAYLVLMRSLVSKALAAFQALVLSIGIFAAQPARHRPRPAIRVLVVNIDGAISVAAARQISRAIDQAKKESATAIVIRLDTPGGLVSATRDIIRDMIAAPVPIIVYVAPSGARAASAGTFIVYASHLAAMAPGTNLGAATPIQMGGLPGAPQQKDEKKSNEPTTAERKAINDVVAWLRSLAQLRGRDLDFADKAVREAATLTADEARKQGVVEIVAGSVDDLLAQADGRKVMRRRRRAHAFDPGRNGGHGRAGLANEAARRSSPIRTSHSSCCWSGVYGIAVRVLEPGRVRARRSRRHLPAPGADRAVRAAGAIRRARRSCFSASP